MEDSSDGDQIISAIASNINFGIAREEGVVWGEQKSSTLDDFLHEF